MNGLLTRCLIQKHSQGSLECIKEVYLNLEEVSTSGNLICTVGGSPTLLPLVYPNAGCHCLCITHYHSLTS